MKYTILGEQVRDSTEFEKRFKEVTGFSVEEFSEHKDKAKSTGHKYTEVKGKYEYICNSIYSIYSTDLVYVKTLGDYLPKMPKLLDKPLIEYKAGMIILVPYVVILVFIIPIPVYLIVGIAALIRRDKNIFLDNTDEIARGIAKSVIWWKPIEV